MLHALFNSSAVVGRQHTFFNTDLEWNADKQTHYLKEDCLKLRIVHQEIEWR